MVARRFLKVSRDPNAWAKIEDTRHRRRDRLGGQRVDLAAVLAKYGYNCHICGKTIEPEDLSFDHVQPLARGGRHDSENVKPSHLKCNLKKGAKWQTPENAS